jgi:predicted transcriptional regulator
MQNSVLYYSYSYLFFIITITIYSIHRYFIVYLFIIYSNYVIKHFFGLYRKNSIVVVRLCGGQVIFSSKG